MGTVAPVLGPWPEESELRVWQTAFYDTIRRHDGCDFLLVACPGAGKTRAALYVAHRWLTEGRVVRFVVVCHTETLKEQWSEAAGEVGLVLRPDFPTRAGNEAADEHGIAVTYQQVAAAPSIFRRQCRRDTLVILDELHHAGEGNSWTAALLTAFGPAAFRLSLSGTPFRTDGLHIPFVAYDLGDDGVARSRADFRYDYADALRDERVCREVIFPNFDGYAQWEREGDFHAGHLTDECNDEEQKTRLRMVLEPHGKWIPEVLREANERLNELRRSGHPLAGGLVIASDQDDAREYARTLEKIAGEPPLLAVSDVPGAKELIDRFRSGSGRWLVAVRMVSEGVDVPRLRVGVYATNVLTELHFRQVVGRLCRYDRLLEEDQQEGALFIPAVRDLITWAERVKREYAGVVERIRDEVLRDLEEDERAEREGMPARPTFVDSGDATHLGDIWDEQNIPAGELLLAKQFAEEVGIVGRVRLEKLAWALRRVEGAEARPGAASPQPPGEKTVSRQKRDLGRTINTLAAQYVHRYWPGLVGQEFGRKMAETYERLRMLTDGEPATRATLEGKKQRVRLLRDWIDGNGQPVER